MSLGTLLIRADAGIAMGTGHVMRCLALAQAWQDAGGRACFAMADSTAAIRARVAAESCGVADIAAQGGTAADAFQTVEFAKKNKCEWAALDGYQFGEEYQRALKEGGLKVLFLDDYGHSKKYVADLVLNQNISACASLYENRNSSTRLLLGPRYCLLRREFGTWRNWKREIQDIGRRVLVTMGGSDPENVTAWAMEALAGVEVEGFEAVVAVGGSNPHADMLGRIAAESRKKIRLLRDVANIAEQMAWADVALSSAGTTCWELCLLALPSILVDVAANQTALATEMGRRGCAIHVGRPKQLSAHELAAQIESLARNESRRGELSVRCRELVDGRGAERVVLAMTAKLRLRDAQETDCRLLWEWANDPQVREAAFSSAPIPWDAHQAWFTGKMKDPNCTILIAEDDGGRQVGQFRVDWRSEQEGDIDISVAAQFRGSGNGAVLIDLAVGRVFAEKGDHIYALVKIENQASRRAFEQAGFSSLGEERVNGHPAIRYVRKNELALRRRIGSTLTTL
jgi:UDP-2,4-diacetamido-2,4,6-trideoxy-beta-L-altropyranose hydrolase